MALSIAGMMVVMQVRGLQQSMGVAIGMTALSVASAVVLARMLRTLRAQALRA
jgi:predicted Kef-type K+ transport protein